MVLRASALAAERDPCWLCFAKPEAEPDPGAGRQCPLGMLASRLQDVIAGDSSSYSCFDLLTVNTTVWVKQPVAQLGLG